MKGEVLMFLEEFPHKVMVLKLTRVPDGGGGYTEGWTESHSFYGFLDTPSSKEIYQAEQLQHPFDRNLFYPYGEDLTTSHRVECEGDTYELASKPMDQGGQHEVMKVNLRLVNDG